MALAPFSIPAFEPELADLRARLRQTRWPDEPAAAAWDYGFDGATLRALCAYWRDHFDWAAQAARMAAFPHFRFTTAGGLAIHFIHARGRGPKPLPLLITHGWPGSFLEMLRLIPLLADPAAHGGEAADAFDVIVPSLPGFGFSDRPSRPGMNLFRIAELWVEMMTALGYDRFAVQGGDFGAGVNTALGLRHASKLLGLHLNYIPGSYRPYLPAGAPLAPEEEQFLREAAAWSEAEGGYAHVQRRQPQTLAYALNDSPAGLAAWIAEKFRSWSDCGGALERRFSRDEILAGITLYWLTQTIGSSLRLYYETARAPLHFAAGDFVHPPCAIARFPAEAPFPPRTWVARGYNVQRWTEMPRGGHFAAAEEPELLAADVRAFFRPLR